VNARSSFITTDRRDQVRSISRVAGSRKRGQCGGEHFDPAVVRRGFPRQFVLVTTARQLFRELKLAAATCRPSRPKPNDDGDFRDNRKASSAVRAVLRSGSFRLISTHPQQHCSLIGFANFALNAVRSLRAARSRARSVERTGLRAIVETAKPITAARWRHQ
jgi:hypothetical protein